MWESKADQIVASTYGHRSSRAKVDCIISYVCWVNLGMHALSSRRLALLLALLVLKEALAKAVVHSTESFKVIHGRV